MNNDKILKCMKYQSSHLRETKLTWSLCKLFFEQRYGSCVCSTLVLPKLRDKNTKFTLPFYHWNIRKSCYLHNPGIKTWNTDLPEDLKTLACYILFWWRYINWNPTSNIRYFNSYSILKGMCKRKHSFWFFKIYEIRYQDIR